VTHTEALHKALAALHEIGGAIATRNLLAKPMSNPIIRCELERKALTDHQIQQLALDTWETLVMQVRPRLDGTTIFECSPTPEPSGGPGDGR
jgi:hypothetical protein